MPTSRQGSTSPGAAAVASTSSVEASRSSAKASTASTSASEEAAPTSRQFAPERTPAQQSSMRPTGQLLPTTDEVRSASGSSSQTSSSSASVKPAAAAGSHRARSNSRAGQPPAAPDLSVTWLGTSSGNPSLRRNVSCIALALGQSTYLVDCGEGTSRQVLRANIPPASIRGVFISHLHGDHCFGLPGLIELVSEAHRAMQSPIDTTILRVQGPPGVQQLVKGALAVSQLHAGHAFIQMKPECILL